MWRGRREEEEEEEEEHCVEIDVIIEMVFLSVYLSNKMMREKKMCLKEVKKKKIERRLR